ncbi:MAG: molybdopterin cofactor-binding domain-containing protein, partial [Spirochaetota bacterium]
MSKSNIISRREFLQVSVKTGAGLVIGVYLSGCKSLSPVTQEPNTLPSATPEPTVPPTAAPGPVAPLKPNAFLKIDPNGEVTVTVHRSEMGQGVRTALPMMVAEELETDWSTIRIEQAPADRVYGDQLTGGSHSIERTFLPLRRAGAVAREMLIAVAAQAWGVEKETCYAEKGVVLHRSSNRRLTFGELVKTAATMPAPGSDDVTLKDPKDFRIIGTRVGQLDNPQIVDGSAVYGMDIRAPEMLYATIARSPVFDGEAASFDATQAQAVEGVRHVVQINNGIAVVAESTWAALQGRQALQIEWDEGTSANLSSANIKQTLAELLANAKSSDKISAARTLEAIYEVPLLAHAPMEPMNCVADVRSDRCEVWAPTQNPQAAKSTVMSITGLPEKSITLHVTLIGGGFGRRLNVDYVPEAVQISKAIG